MGVYAGKPGILRTEGKSATKTRRKHFFKNIQTQYGEDMTIGDGGIDSLEQPEDPVKVHYSFNAPQAGETMRRCT